MRRSDIGPHQFLKGGQVICGRNATRLFLNTAMKQAAGFPDAYPRGLGEKIICLKNRHDLGLVNGMFLDLSDIRDEEKAHMGELVTLMRYLDPKETELFLEGEGEVEATAWAYAASVALGLDPAVLFHEGGYHGKSAGLVLTYALGVYPGAKGLADAGMTQVGDQARQAGVPPYPHMTTWLRE